MSDKPCLIPANADIAGIGVRVSVYIQLFTAVIPGVLKSVEDASIARELRFAQREKQKVVANDNIEPSNPATEIAPPIAPTRSTTVVDWQDVQDMVAPNLLLGYSLLISAIIQSQTFGLTVYHGLIVLNLNWIIILSLLPSFQTPRPYERDDIDRLAFYRRLYKQWAFYNGLVTFTAGFGLWFFAHIRTFDNTQNDCTTSTVYWVFGRHVPVDSAAFRRFWIAIYALIACPILNHLFLSVFFSIVSFLTLIVQGILIAISACIGALALRCFGAGVLDHRGVTIIKEAMFSAVVYLSSRMLQNLLLVSTEQTIAINTVGPGEGDWTFGQTVAVIVAVFQVWDIVLKVGETFARVARTSDVSGPAMAMFLELKMMAVEESSAPCSEPVFQVYTETFKSDGEGG